MNNVRDRARDAYIYEQRKYAKKKLRVLAEELQISSERVRQVYEREREERNKTGQQKREG